MEQISKYRCLHSLPPSVYGVNGTNLQIPLSTLPPSLCIWCQWNKSPNTAVYTPSLPLYMVSMEQISKYRCLHSLPPSVYGVNGTNLQIPLSTLPPSLCIWCQWNKSPNTAVYTPSSLCIWCQWNKSPNTAVYTPSLPLYMVSMEQISKYRCLHSLPPSLPESYNTVPILVMH